METAGIFGYYALGILSGLLLMRWLFRAAHRDRFGAGPCAICSREGFQVRCKACRRQVAMCHYFGVLFPDSPDPGMFRSRKSVQLCTECMPENVRKSVESL